MEVRFKGDEAGGIDLFEVIALTAADCQLLPQLLFYFAMMHFPLGVACFSFCDQMVLLLAS